MSTRVLKSFAAGVIIVVCASGEGVFGQSETPRSFTIQVGAFPSYQEARRLIVQLRSAGERPVWGDAEVPGRGTWVRVLVGSFTSVKTAREYARKLQAQGAINEFLVKDGAEFEDFSAAGKRSKISERVRKIGEGNSQVLPARSATLTTLPSSRTGTLDFAAADSLANVSGLPNLPVGAMLSVVLKPVEQLPEPAAIDLARFIGSDDRQVRSFLPVQVAVLETAPVSGSATGGLWVGGNVAEALARLRWIAGPASAAVLSIGDSGRVIIDEKALAAACGIIGAPSVEQDQTAARCIKSNEGLLLLVQIAFSSHRYLLHISNTAPTLGGPIQVQSATNLDNRFDSRINPRRPHGRKYPDESPPKGFDDLIAISPDAEWVNLASGKLLPPGIVAFHELAEAYSKVDLDMEYLPSSGLPGAHETAVKRELKLRSERPGSDFTVSEGRNRVFESEKEFVKYRAGLRDRY